MARKPREWVRFLCVLHVTVGCITQTWAAEPGDVVFQTDFAVQTEQALWSRAPYAQWIRGSNSVTVHVQAASDKASDTHVISRPLTLKPWAGCELLFQCRAKALNVTRPLQPYLGVKFLLHYDALSSGPVWLNENDVYGTFDWKTLSFSVRLPDDVKNAQLNLGLQGSSGSVWFDEVRVAVLSPPRKPRPAPLDNPGSVFRGHNLPRLRGVMSPNAFNREDLRVLGQDWHANLIRWQITRNWGKAGTDRDLEEYDRWFAAELADLDLALDACLEFGIKVVIDMHSPPGGRYENSDHAIFHEPVYQDKFVALWEQMARRYLGHPAIWGYDLINEPVQNKPSPPGVANWLGTQVRAARAIRVIDPNRPIFIAPAKWGSADGFQDLEPVDVPYVIYQTHMYFPHAFTHQGVSNKTTGIAFPGEVNGQWSDKAALRQHLKPVREFQLAYNVHIYAGEFSAIRWAPGDSAYQYLKAAIELFEEYGWDWSYHAYREWDGWSVEHGSDPNDHTPSPQPTDRKKLLLGWFEKNAQP
jgi:endoglucanase